MYLNLNGSLPFLSRPASILFLALLICSVPLTASCYELIVGAGPEGTFSHYIGKVFCRKLEKHQPDISCNLGDPAGQVDYLTNVQGGSVDLALVDSQILHDAQEGKGPFAFLDISYDRIRMVAPLYMVPVTIVVHDNGGITSSSQLPGKGVNVGPIGSVKRAMFLQVMDASGWSEHDFPLLGELSSSMSQDVLGFRQGRYQAMVHRGVHPDRSVSQLLSDSRARLVGFTGAQVSDMVSSNAALSVTTIPADIYEGTGQDTFTFGSTVALITSEDLDNDTARAITGMLIKEEAVLQGMHPALSAFQLTNRTEFLGGLKVHPAVLEEADRR
jgi:TRAP transporter TAXI family solute receptor